MKAVYRVIPEVGPGVFYYVSVSPRDFRVGIRLSLQRWREGVISWFLRLSL